MALSEIEKLERRYAENPQGLTFAPLAEVHRKNGDVARALELLRPGLTLHPDYIPASIVLGRCHLDLGDLPSAEAAFAHVLALDGENVIALKALADITERLSRFDEAERWLRTLLEIDRSNDEARDQLGRVETARRQTEGSAVVPTADEAATVAAPVAAAPVLGDAESAPSVDGVSSGDGNAGQPLAGLVGRDEGSGEAGSHDGAGEFRVEIAEDIVLNSSGGSEFQMANAAEELLGVRDSPSVESPQPDSAAT